MDKPLSGRVTSGTAEPFRGGAVIYFKGSSAAEMQREADRLFAAYANTDVCPRLGTPPTCATCVRGMTLGAAGNGASFLCGVQCEPNEPRIADPDPTPWADEIPLDAIGGQYGGLAYAQLQFFESTDASELARLNTWATDFWIESFIQHDVAFADPWLHEVQIAGAGAGRHYLVAVLWGFWDPEPLERRTFDRKRSLAALEKRLEERAKPPAGKAAKPKAEKADK